MPIHTTRPQRSLGFRATNGRKAQVSGHRLRIRLERPVGTSGYFGNRPRRVIRPLPARRSVTSGSAVVCDLAASSRSLAEAAISKLQSMRTRNIYKIIVLSIPEPPLHCSGVIYDIFESKRIMSNAYVIKIPKELPDKSLERFFRGWRWVIPWEDTVVLDFNECEFLAPWVLAAFASYGLWLNETCGKTIEVAFDPSTYAGRFLVTSGFSALFGDEEGNPADSEYSVILRQVKHSSDVPIFARAVTNVLHIADTELEGALEYSFVELLRNVVQHSGSAIGGIAMAQVHPKSGLVEIAVADRGVGVRAHISRRYPEAETDLHALKVAILPHASGTFGQNMYGSMQNNAGLGLFFVKEISGRGGGSFDLISGGAMISRWGKHDARKGSRDITMPSGIWAGTLAVVKLKAGLIGSFDLLLDTCRSLASEAREDPYLQALEFVDSLEGIEDAKLKVNVNDYYEDVEAAAKIRDTEIIPALERNETVVVDFSGIRVITQSFAHAIFYRLLRDMFHVRYSLYVYGCTNAVKAAIRAVSAYARTSPKPSGLPN